MREKKIATFLLILSLYFFGIFVMRLYAAEQEQAQAGIERPKEEFAAEGLRDPFRDCFSESSTGPGGTETGEAKAPEIPLPTLTVQGVVCGGRLNQAIINNKILKVGDDIEGATITNIDKKGITVFFDNRSLNISSPAAETLQDLKKKPEGGRDEK